jgi:L-ascorbate metabolism protein UlaG (beta-lactamase superfamily)
MGQCYSLLVQHGRRRVLVQGSAGTVLDSPLQARAEVVYLAVGALSRQSEQYHLHYWSEVVKASGARRVLPIHWDDFSRSLSRPLVPLPYLFDDFTGTLGFLDSQAQLDGAVDIRIPEVWRASDPFAGLNPA